MRLIFMGTPDFSVPALDALVAAGHGVAAVYTQPPRPAGRGKKPRQSAVAERADALGLPVRTPARLRDPGEQAGLKALEADAAVVVAYGLILPPPVLAAPRLGCFNIHASLLPRWRGAAPIQRAIMAGDAETGVAIMAMEAGLDTGPVFRSETTPIGPDDTAGTLHDRLSTMGAALMVSVLADWPLAALPQPEQGVSYAEKIDKAEAEIDWSQPAAVIDRQIRGLSPFPGAWTRIGGERVKILLSGVLAADRPADPPAGTAPGTVLDTGLAVACGSGALRLIRLQRSGRQPAETSAFLNGFPVEPGARLG